MAKVNCNSLCSFSLFKKAGKLNCDFSIRKIICGTTRKSFLYRNDFIDLFHQNSLTNHLREIFFLNEQKAVFQTKYFGVETLF